MYELPLFSAHHEWHNWWIKGAGLAQIDNGGLATNGGPGLEAEKL